MSKHKLSKTARLHHKTVSAVTPGRRKTSNFNTVVLPNAPAAKPVEVKSYSLAIAHELVRRDALRRAGGDRRLLQVLSDGSIVVHNNSSWRRR